jgi:hypothetical protein
MWHFRGTTAFLERQAHRLGSTQILASKAKHNPEIHRVSVLLAQLCDRYHKQRKEDGEPVFYPIDILSIKATLGVAEQELQKLHMLAGSADAMLTEAYGAFNIDAPSRSFVILAESDDGEPLPTRNDLLTESKKP